MHHYRTNLETLDHEASTTINNDDDEIATGPDVDVDRHEHQVFEQNRRQRQRHLGSLRRKSFSFVSSNSPLVFLMAVSCLLLQQRPCTGSEGASSSFQRPPPPPPPPPGSSFPRDPRTGVPNDEKSEYIPTNGNGENYDYFHPQHQQQQEAFSSPSSGYPEEVNSIERPPQTQQQPNPSSYSQQKDKPSMPIHYEFPAANDDEVDTMGKGRRREIGLDQDGKRPSSTASARKDLVTRYWSTKKGKMQIQSVIGLVGYGSGSFVAKSMVGSADVTRWSGYFWAAFLIISTWFRTPMGELSRAMGLSLILVLQRTQRIRREYPTWRFVAASVGILRGGPRDARGRPRGPRPFPPARNPWRYSPRSPQDPDFNMMYTLVSMAMVGSTVGGNMPFIPNWIGALVGAALFAFACTWQNSHRGDLARTMGMRVVRAVTELWEIQADLQIIPKATVVSSQIIDKAMILDRKHRVKDKFLSLASKGYAQASKVAEQIQQQQRGGNKNDGDRDRNNDDDRDRRGRNKEDDSDDLRRDERRDGGWRREGRNRDRDNDDDPRLERGGNGRERGSDRGDDDLYYSRDRQGPEGRRQPRRGYDDEEDDRYGDRKRVDNDGSMEEGNDKKSKGFFFRRK